MKNNKKPSKVALWSSIYQNWQNCTFLSFHLNWHQIEFLYQNMFILWTHWQQISIETTIKTIKKCYCGHLYLKKLQTGTFSIILQQNWRQLTSNIDFWPKINIKCTHWHQISIKTSIKTIKKWYCGHLYLKNW